MKFTPRLALMVFLGGALGTLARFELNAAITYFWLLVVVNVFGSFLLGVANGDAKATERSRAFFGVGFAGGFTTMSGVSLLILMAVNELPMLVIYLAAMFGMSLGAYLLGLRTLSGSKK